MEERKETDVILKNKPLGCLSKVTILLQKNIAALLQQTLDSVPQAKIIVLIFNVNNLPPPTDMSANIYLIQNILHMKTKSQVRKRSI